MSSLLIIRCSAPAPAEQIIFWWHRPLFSRLPTTDGQTEKYRSIHRTETNEITLLIFRRKMKQHILWMWFRSDVSAPVSDNRYLALPKISRVTFASVVLWNIRHEWNRPEKLKQFLCHSNDLHSQQTHYILPEHCMLPLTVSSPLSIHLHGLLFASGILAALLLTEYNIVPDSIN